MTIPVRDAATLIVLRHGAQGPRVLMGQRGRAATFMPGKFVFPGGAVDACDADMPFITPLDAAVRERLLCDSTAKPEAIVAAAIRELWEEAGLILGRPAATGTVPEAWRGFADTGHLPSGSGLRFVFRAITPAGNPRRFDARFLLVDSAALASDPDDFGHATDELSSLQWVRLAEARTFDLPFITKVVMAELTALVADPAQPAMVPFFRNDDEANLVHHLGGRDPLVR